MSTTGQTIKTILQKDPGAYLVHYLQNTLLIIFTGIWKALQSSKKANSNTALDRSQLARCVTELKRFTGSDVTTMPCPQKAQDNDTVQSVEMIELSGKF